MWAVLEFEVGSVYVKPGIDIYQKLLCLLLIQKVFTEQPPKNKYGY